jgi:hypothetical protein
MNSLLRRLQRALPVVIVALPGVIDAVRQVRAALRRQPSPAEPVARGNGA